MLAIFLWFQNLDHHGRFPGPWEVLKPDPPVENVGHLDNNFFDGVFESADCNAIPTGIFWREFSEFFQYFCRGEEDCVHELFIFMIY